MYSAIFRNILFPIMERFNGTEIQKNLKELEKTQWLSRKDLEVIQLKKLRSLVYQSYSNVPYYHSLFKSINLYPDDIKSLDDLRKIPVLTKEHVKQNQSVIKATNYTGALIPAASGGSSGEPVQFFRTKEDFSCAWAAAFRGWKWAGYDLGERYATLWGNPVGVAQQKKVLKKVKNTFMQNISLSAYDMTDQTLDEYVRIIRRYNPKIIRGYAQALFVMSQYMNKNGISDLHPVSVLTTAETLFGYQRSEIEKEFGCRVFDGYGGGEAPAAAYECQEHCGYHISSENIILEFVKDGEIVSSGEKGKILVTNLNNYAIPFIRYDMEDIGIPSDDICSCGRGLPLMKSIEGRVNDMIVTPEGKFIHSYVFSAIFRNMHSIDQFQVIQETENTVTIKIVNNELFGEQDMNYIKTTLTPVLGENIRLRVECVTDIPILSGSGKRRFVVSKVPIRF